jgi:hypothetical protein
VAGFQARVPLRQTQAQAYDNRVVVAGHAFDKAGGKMKNADQTIAIDRATASALSGWRGVQDRERDFFGADYSTAKLHKSIHKRHENGPRRVSEGHFR